MLRVGPWNRLALTIQWLKPQYAQDFDPALQPPTHMPLQYGLVISKRVSAPQEQASAIVSSPTSQSVVSCDVCLKEVVDADFVKCLAPECRMNSHIQCLAKHFLKSDADHVLPLEGSCPVCRQEFLWADVIRKLKGCYQDSNLTLHDTTLN